jgi:hypothetical protein
MHHKVTLPDFLLPFLVSSYEFENIAFRSYSGRDYITNKTGILVKAFYIRSARLSLQEFKDIIKFYSDRSGAAASFEIFDPSENIIEREILIESEDRRRFSLNDFFLRKRSNRSRNISSIIPDSIRLYKDDEAIDFRYHEDEMIIEIEEPLEASKELKISFIFLSKVRFLSTKIESSFEKDGSISLNELVLREVVDA